MMRGMILLAFAVCAGAGNPLVAQAHEFEAPEVVVAISFLEPGGHPDLQTTIELSSGEPFEHVEVVGPAGSGVTSDAEIPDGTIVGRLDAVSTTNALVRPECDATVAFSVPLVEAPTDPSTPSYPVFLRDAAPGQHRLRFVADVSPNAANQVVINYLFDLDPISGSVVSQIFVGDPTAPPPDLVTCTPLQSVVTIFGTLDDGTPVLTSPNPLPPERLPFRFTFTSRPSADGHRHTRQVEARVAVSTINGRPTAVPTAQGTIEPVPMIPAPANLRLESPRPTGEAPLRWDLVPGFETYQVEIIRDGGESGVGTAPGAGLPLPPEAQPSCTEGVTFRVSVYLEGAGVAGVAELYAPPRACTGITAPDTGQGASTRVRPWMVVALVLLPMGALLLMHGVQRRT